MTEERKQKPLTPPYMSLPQLERLIDLVSSRNIPEFSLSVFRGYGFNEFDASIAGGALRFLGLADEQNKPTDKMSKLRLKGDARKKAFGDIVRAGYKKLFDAVDEPHKLPPDDLSNEMVVQYDLTPRVLKSAMPAFLKLCEYAGMIEEGSIVARKHKAREGKPRATSAKPRASVGAPARKNTPLQEFAGSDLYLQPIVKGKMVITIPEDVFLRTATDDDLNDDWRKVLKAAHAFAEQHLKDESSNPEEPEDS